MKYEEYTRIYKTMKDARIECPGYGAYCASCRFLKWASSTEGYPAEAEMESRCVLAKK